MNILDLEPKFSEDDVAMATFLKTFSEICTVYQRLTLKLT